MNASRWFILLFWLTSSFSGWAHPVAQGALDLQVSPAKLQIQLRVSGEEVVVADTFAGGNKLKAASLAEVWARHGQYLLQHLKVFTDGRGLRGEVVQVEAAQNDSVVYHLEFATATRPARLRIEEDVLNEIEFAPGNAWEASYVARILQQGRPAQEGLLLSRKQPLVFDCAWKSLSATQGGTTALLDRWRMTRQFCRLGVGHILSGYDHLLFVCGLVLGAVTLWDLVKVVTAFTLAHTLTLTLSVLNIVRLQSHIVEPMIAGSIVFVAVTNLLWPKHSRGHVRLATAFFFGLFHGLGFAGGLLDAMNGMSGLAVGVAITAFSLGVELGHQMIVLPVFFGVQLARRVRADAPGRERISLAVMRAGSLLICVAGMCYLLSALK